MRKQMEKYENNSFKKKYTILFLCSVCVYLILTTMLSSSFFYRDFEVENTVVSDDFNGARAVEYMEEITSNYQYRIFGSKEVKSLGEYIGKTFESLGLQTESMEFSVKRPAIDKFFLKFDLVDNDVNLAKDSYRTIMEDTEGVNIIGLLPGSSDEIILIGAHRDIARGIQGAEDNASGTGLMMELASEIAEKQNYYTYMFVSFDGEEAQEKGSKYFVNHYSNMEKLKLVMVLDQVGYREADSLALYAPYGGFRQIPLGLHKIIYSTMQACIGKSPSYADKSWTPGYLELVSHLFKINYLSANTDSNPFLTKRIPSFGIKAYDSISNREAYVHDNYDTMENISVETMSMSGNFIKTMITNIESSPDLIDDMKNETWYLLAGNRYLPDINMQIYIGFSIIFLVCIGIYTCLYIKQSSFGGKIKAKQIILLYLWILVVSGCAVAVTAYGIDNILSKIPLLYLLLAWFGIVFIGIRVGKKLLQKMQINGEASCAIQILMTIALTPVYAVVSSVEYAILVGIMAVMINSIALIIRNRYVTINKVIGYIWAICQVILSLMTFNVFFRGVDINKYVVLQIINLFLFFSIRINVFGNKEKVSEVDAR